MGKPTHEEIQKAKQVLKDAGYIGVYWCDDDIREAAKNMGIELTDDQVNDIIGYIERKHDANIGINWESIEVFIDMIVNPYV